MANRLGIQWMKVELEDSAFKYLEPEDYQALLAKMAGARPPGRLHHRGLGQAARGDEGGRRRGQVSGRAKHLWSIHQKMKRTARDLEQIQDIIAFRIMTGSVRDCYAALGVVHSHWTPVPGRFKDFIALPKPNLYQSLHTTVIGPRSERMEVQIRTQEMHRTAEQGIAAHWQYKEKTPLGPGRPQGLRLAPSIDGVAARPQGPTEFIETVKIDLFEEEVFVFTPKGDVKALPKGATPSTSPTPSTPRWASAARGRGSTASSCPCATRCATGTPSTSSPRRPSGRPRTG
jgi:GTP pyrophosphokinase